MTNNLPRKSLIARYNEKALARGAVNVAPAVVATATGHPEFGLLGPAADALLASVSTWSLDLFRKKMQEWLIALSDADVPLDDARMQTDEDFALAVLTTTAIATRSHGCGKLHWLAMLLKNYDRINLSGSIEDFYDFQSILDDISVRELQALLLLRDLENSPDRPRRITVIDDETEQQAGKTDLEWAKGFWTTLENSIIHSGVSRSQLTGFFDRLQRTGLFRQFGVWGDNKAHPWGYTTANLAALVDTITRHDEEQQQD